MLVLGRKVDERITIRDTESGETITVMVVEIIEHEGKACRVRLGIEASPRFSIVREEVDDQG